MCEKGQHAQKTEEIIMKIKRIIAGLSCAALAAGCVGFTASADSSVSNNFEPIPENVKILGRAKYINDDYLWFGQTCAGIEFKFNGSYAMIHISSDGNGMSDASPTRYRIFLDGELQDYYLVENKTFTHSIYADDGEHTVRLEKVSENENGTMRITEITTDAESIEPTEDKAHKIEFVGDSITCGYGVDGVYGKDSFYTKNEDGSKTYAYKAAKILGSDYSFFSFSGCGVYSGYPDQGKRNTTLTMEQYYDKLGMSWYSDFQWDHQMKDEDWDFEQYTPGLVVVNLGTNDNSYKGLARDVENKDDIDPLFVESYVSLLKKIRSCNPDAEILCTYGIMGDDFKDLIQTAADDYMTETGDEKINTFFFPVQDEANDGVAVDWHPSDVTHSKDAILLAEKINELYGWDLDETEYPDVEPVTPDDSSSDADSSSEPDSSSVEDSSSDSSSAADSSSSTADSSSSSSSSSSTASSSVASTTSTKTTTTTTTTTTTSTDSSPATGVKSAAAVFSLVAAGALVAVRKSRK